MSLDSRGTEKSDFTGSSPGVLDGALVHTRGVSLGLAKSNFLYLSNRLLGGLGLSHFGSRSVAAITAIRPALTAMTSIIVDCVQHTLLQRDNTIVMAC